MKSRLIAKCLAASALTMATLHSRAAQAPDTVSLGGDPIRGKVLYQACQACHSIEENDLGPRHRGVVGRRAGSVADYNYSLALKNSGLTWDSSTLDR
jgi:cytochrome c